jgi:hypothetical protein
MIICSLTVALVVAALSNVLGWIGVAAIFMDLSTILNIMFGFPDWVLNKVPSRLGSSIGLAASLPTSRDLQIVLPTFWGQSIDDDMTDCK